ncbi:MAG: hypothetical protein IPJ65_11825 [Archangiaceae bacterium]|nr:hypothetical protein [Archangiaceae bacterium]
MRPTVALAVTCSLLSACAMPDPETPPPGPLGEDAAPLGQTVRAVDYSGQVTVFAPPAQANELNKTTRASEWTGTFVLPDQSVVVAFNLTTGPTSPRLSPARTFMSESDLNKFHDGAGRAFTYRRPVPSGYVPFEKGFDYSGLAGACPASPTLPTHQACSEVVYLRSTDRGEHFTPWRTEPYRALIPAPYAPQATTALPDGTLVRRVNGDDLRNLDGLPYTAMLQTLAPGSASWPALGAANQTVIDPVQCKYQVSRIRALSGGRYIALGQSWRLKSGASTGCPATGASVLLLVADSASAVKRGQWSVGMPFVPDATLTPNEWDAAELPNGDLLALFRTQASATDRTPVRKQAVLRVGSSCGAAASPCWVLDRATLGNPGNFKHSGHPELLSTPEGVVLSFASDGISYTVNRGASWSLLPGLGEPTRYYPRATRDAAGTLYVFSHAGSDQPYGGKEADKFSGVAQSILMQRFRLDVGVTQPSRPSVATAAATAVSTTGAALNGSVNPNAQTTSYWFEYGATAAYGAKTAEKLLAASGATAVSAAVVGLAADTVVHFRVAARNGSGVSYGADLAFRTRAPTGQPTPEVGYSQLVIADGPVAYWRLGEASGAVASDAVGDADGTYRKGVTLGSEGAVEGDTAATFDGVDGDVLVPARPALELNESFTAEAWVKPSRLDAALGVVNAVGSWFLYLDGGRPVLYVPGWSRLATGTAVISDAAWHHVAVTRAGDDVRLYLDGADVTGAVVARALAPNAGFTLGSGAGRFAGQLDEVAVYGVALSPAAIATHAAAR